MKEETKDTPLTPQRQKGLPLGAIIAIAIGGGLIIGIASFAGGIQFARLTNQTTTNPLSQNSREPGSRSRLNANGAFGEVTAISDSSITIATRERFNSGNTSNTATTKTYTINSATTITVNGSTGTISDIKSGDTVMVEASTSDSSLAASIRVGMGRMGGPMGQQQATDNSTDDTSTRTN